MDYLASDLQCALTVLQDGGVILYPTDTVWGIGCDATNSAAVRRIYRLKHRADSRAMLVLIAPPRRGAPEPSYPDRVTCRADSPEVCPAEARPTTYIHSVPTAIAQGLIGADIAPELIAADHTIGIRVTNEAFSRALCEGLGHPLVSTSANISGEPSATCYAQISDPIKQAVDYICAYRRNDETEHQPSRIIRIAPDGTPIVLRE